MNYNKIILLVFLVLSSFFIYGQKKIDGYRYYSIKDTISCNNDSIRFIFSGKTIKPTIIFIQGSMPVPLFVSFGDTTKCFFNSLISEETFNAFNFIIISKPNIPIIKENENEQICEENLKEFTKCNNKDYYILSIKNVYEFIKHKHLIDTALTYIVGHSQGYGIACKYANIYPDDFKKIVCMSSSIYNVPIIRINQIREKMIYGVYEEDFAKHLIDSIYTNMDNIRKGFYDKNNPYYYNYKKDFSFAYETNIEFLLSIKKPLLTVYGYKDVASMDNCYLPVIFKINNKNNLSVLSYPKLGHNYFLKQYDENGNILKNEFHWPNVMDDVGKWLLAE